MTDVFLNIFNSPKHACTFFASNDTIHVNEHKTSSLIGTKAYIYDLSLK